MDLPTTRHDQSKVAGETSGAKMPKSSGGSVLKKISYSIFLISLFLAPLVFIPSSYAPIDVVKSIFLSITILLAAILYTIDAMKNRTLSLPKSLWGYSAVGVVLSIVVSTLLSVNIGKSFIGQGFELATASFLLLMFVAAYLVSRMVIKDKEVVFKIYTSIFVAFVVLVIFQIARLFGGVSFMNLGFLSTVTATLVGRWYDFAIFTALIGLLSFIGMKFLPLRSGLKQVLAATLVVSLIVLFVANSAFIWALFALIVFFIGIYEYRDRLLKNDAFKTVMSRVSILTAVVFVIAVACMWKGNVIAGPVVKHFGAEYGEPILPWPLTLDIASDTLKESPLFGAGPNRFSYQYLRFKPLEINQTIFWNTEFTSGFGLIPTFTATQGLIGIILWILFLFFFVKEGVRALRSVNDPLKKFFITSSFFVAAFLWCVDIIYVPSHVIVYLTFIFTGIFAALIISEGQLHEKHIVSGAVGSKAKKLIPIIYSIAIIVLIVWLGLYLKKTIAVTHFEKGIKSLNITKSTDVAQAEFKKALMWDNSEVYYQALSEINIIKINALSQEMQTFAAQNPGAATDQKKIDQLLALVTESVKYTKTAESIDPNNYYNYLAEARIAELGVTLSIPNAYENAKNAYMNALQTNPANPGIYLNLARLEASQNKGTEAQQYIGRALQLKPNYTEAIFLLSQLQVANNQIKDAIVSTQVTIQLNPNEPLLYFQLGFLEYNDKNYAGAITALEKAVLLNNQYANARYFLGLSYARMGRNADAIAQFEELAKTNPDNQEITFILGNLKQGKSPFTDVQPPIDSKPEKRKTLPVAEKSTPAAVTPSVSPSKSPSPSAAKKAN